MIDYDREGGGTLVEVWGGASEVRCGTGGFGRCSTFNVQRSTFNFQLSTLNARLSTSALCLSILLIIFLAAMLPARAQNADSGSVSGLVVSTWDGSPLSSVIVTVRGTTLAAQSDAGGRFELKNVPPGEQALRFSRSGFATVVVTDVRVAAGQNTTVNGNMRPEFHDMEEYEVTAEELGEQTERILFERQNAATMMDAIGSDMFRNLAVSDAAGALSRVTGATVADGKYAVIRGLADRYTFTTMNGTELPSADPDRRAFQLDLFPARFIGQIDVRKTFTPDMSGGFAGGSIDIVTRSYPEKPLFEARMETAYNTQSSLRNDFASTDRSSTDWLGFDDGLRKLPNIAAATSPQGNQPLPAEVKDSFRSTQWAPVAMDSPLDAGMSFQFGDTRRLFGKRVGYLAGFNYKNEYRYYNNGRVRSYQTPNEAEVDKTEVLGLIDYQWGGLATISLELMEGHDLKFNFLYIQAAQDEARRLQGQVLSANTSVGESYIDQSVLHWTERNLTYYQLAGAHDFAPLGGVHLDWAAALSTTTQDEPDFRIFQFKAEPGSPRYTQTTAAQPTRPTRYWRDLDEENKNVRADLTVPLPSYNSKDNFLKLGAAHSESRRHYAQRGFDYTIPNSHPFVREGDPNEFLSDDNRPFTVMRNFPINLVYDGQQTVNAVYMMGDWAVLDWVRLIGGARLEDTDLSIVATNLTNPGISPAPGKIRQTDLLPSLGAVIQLRDNVDLRAAWSRTVVRPTYREIAEVDLYDVTQNRVYLGNPALRVSSSENFDLRASWYPRPGEVLSAGWFAKRIQDPIELAAQDREYNRIQYQNFEKADVMGIEGELRLRLDRLWKPLEAFTLGFNGAWIRSEVPLTEQERINRGPEGYGDFSTSRPLYNQPSFILNGDLTWESVRTGTTITLSGGVVGERLILVGLARPDEFEQPAPDLNLYIRQRLGKHWDVRFTAKNLLNPEFQIAQTWPGAGQRVLKSYTKGMTFGLSVGCEF